MRLGGVPIRSNAIQFRLYSRLVNNETLVCTILCTFHSNSSFSYFNGLESLFAVACLLLFFADFPSSSTEFLNHWRHTFCKQNIGAPSTVCFTDLDQASEILS